MSAGQGVTRNPPADIGRAAVPGALGDGLTLAGRFSFRGNPGERGQRGLRGALAGRSVSNEDEQARTLVLRPRVPGPVWSRLEALKDGIGFGPG